MEFSWQGGLKTNNFTPRAEAVAFTPSQRGSYNTNGGPLWADPTRSGYPQSGSTASGRRQQNEQHQRYRGSNVCSGARAHEGPYSKGPKGKLSVLPIHSAQKPGPLIRDLAQKRGQPQHDAGPLGQGRRGTVAGHGYLSGSSRPAPLEQNPVPVPQQYNWTHSITGYQEDNTDLRVSSFGANTTMEGPQGHDCYPLNKLQEQTHVGNGIRKPKRTPLARHKYQLGVIIRAPLHTKDFDQGTSKSYRGSDTAQKMQKYISQSALGDFVHSKIRKFIVVSLLDEDHYMAVPLCTNNGEGLIRKKPAAYVSVQDHRQPPIRPQGNGVVITTQELEDHVDPYHPMSVAHTGDPVARRYGAPVVYEGRLDAASTGYVVQLWLDVMGRGTKNF